jgi:hypothetical protein
MKQKSNISKVIVFLIIYFSVYNINAQQNDSPTLEETLKFIQTKTKDYGNYRTKSTFYDKKNNETIVYDNITETGIEYDKCKLIIIYNVKDASGGSRKSSFNRFEFNLYDIDSGSVNVIKKTGKEYILDDENSTFYTEYLQDLYVMSYKTKDGLKLIKSSNSNGVVEFYSGYSVSFIDKNISERIIKAFTHAISLCEKEKNKEVF